MQVTSLTWNICTHTSPYTNYRDEGIAAIMKNSKSPRFKKSEGDIVIASARPFICPLCYLLLNHWTKFNQIWFTHINRTCNGISPAPWGPGEGSKVQISFNFNYKANFRDFYTKLCVCSHKWKIQNISDGIFILSPGSCPSGGTLGRWGCPGGQKKFQTWPCGISNRRGWRAEQNASKIFILGSN